MTKLTKVLAVGALTGVVSLGTAACSGSASQGGSVPEAGTCLETIKERGELRVGTVSNLPIDAVDTSTGELIGINADVLNAFVKDTKVATKITPEAMPFSSLIPALNSNKIDITSDTMFRTEEREKQIAFTDLLLYNPEGLVVAEGNPKHLQALDDFGDGESVATYQGTVWVDWVHELEVEQGAGAQVFPGANELTQAVGSEQTDAGLMSSAIAGYMIAQNPNLGIELAADYEPRSRDGVATHLGLHKNCTDLKQAFDDWYEGYVSDGRMAKTLEQWGVTPTDTYLDGVAGYTPSQ